mmetsp:Transcript_91521/g.212853  ORF Transcript_91521/g.212853 Transcript_91521/m.212853 type:complete len:254 (-) Transcript_91521:1381-2142(-)
MRLPRTSRTGERMRMTPGWLRGCCCTSETRCTGCCTDGCTDGGIVVVASLVAVVLCEDQAKTGETGVLAVVMGFTGRAGAGGVRLRAAASLSITIAGSFSCRFSSSSTICVERSCVWLSMASQSRLCSRNRSSNSLRNKVSKSAMLRCNASMRSAMLSWNLLRSERSMDSNSSMDLRAAFSRVMSSVCAAWCSSRSLRSLASASQRSLCIDSRPTASRCSPSCCASNRSSRASRSRAINCCRCSCCRSRAERS